MKKTKIALIGCGYWGKNHLKTLMSIDEANLVYVCDAAKPSINIPKGIKFTPNYKEILKDKHIEGVVISTPTSTHYSLSKEFLEAGKDVLVEKPLTTKSIEAEELCAIADKKSLVLMVGEIFRFNPGISDIKNMIDSNMLGELRYIESRRVGLGPVRIDVSVLWDLATHDIYISNLLTRKLPLSVSYSGISHNGHLDDIVTLNMKYENGIFSTIYVNWEHPVKERRLIVGGANQAISFDDMEASEKIKIFERGVNYQPVTGDIGAFKASIRGGKIIIPNVKFAQPLEEEDKAFVSAIKSRINPISNGYDGLATVQVLEAAEASKKNNGIEIKLSYQGGK